MLEIKLLVSIIAFLSNKLNLSPSCEIFMFCIKNQLTAAFINKHNNILLGLNVQSLRCHHDGLLIELENFPKKPRIIALLETWLTEKDSINELTLPGYHPLESKPRSSGQERGGVAFFVQESVTYKPLIFETKIE